MGLFIAKNIYCNMLLDAWITGHDENNLYPLSARVSVKYVFLYKYKCTERSFSAIYHTESDNDGMITVLFYSYQPKSRKW